MNATHEKPGESRDATRSTELERLRHESDTLGTTLNRLLGRSGTHFAGRDADAHDRIEIWGRRIGRGLSAVAVVALCIYLYATYLR